MIGRILGETLASLAIGLYAPAAAPLLKLAPLGWNQLGRNYPYLTATFERKALLHKDLTKAAAVRVLTTIPERTQASRL
jgi:hypothetical protein